MLSDDPINGILSAGYCTKKAGHSDWVDIAKDRYDLVMVLSGTGKYIDDEFGEIPLEAGDCIQRLPGRKHSTIILDNEWSEFYLCVGTALFESMFNIYAAAHKPVLKTGIDFEMIQLFLDIHKKLDTATGVEVPLLLPKAVALVTRAAYLHRINSRTVEEEDILKVAVAYIKDNPGSRMSVEDVADQVDMGYEKFRKLFQQYYGISPGNYILNQRIRAAQSMLSGDKMTIKEIAVELGYRDTSSFSKQFKKVTGRTPTAFRHIYR